MTRVARRCLAVAAGLVGDRLLGEPPSTVHPVAAFGRTMGTLEQRIWADRRQPGLGYAAAGVGLGMLTGKLGRSTALAVGVSVAGRELRRVATQIAAVTVAGDLDRSRQELRSLVGRDPSELDESGIAAAVIESLAENSVDAVVAPVFWAMIAGAPGAGGYRAVNTMDAMVGHFSDRYRNFGWAAARLDDAANYIPARLFAVLVMAQQPRRALRIMAAIRRDAGAHPSPNAGVAETAMAAALGIELGGPLHYGDRLDNRPTLGSGPRPTVNDIERAVKIADRTEQLIVALLVAASLDSAAHSMRTSQLGSRSGGKCLVPLTSINLDGP